MPIEQLCQRCNLYPRYKHPQTGKIYKLCAKCGWEALTKLLGFNDNPDKQDKQKIDEILKLN